MFWGKAIVTSECNIFYSVRNTEIVTAGPLFCPCASPPPSPCNRQHSLSPKFAVYKLEGVPWLSPFLPSSPEAMCSFVQMAGRRGNDVVSTHLM